MLVNVGLPLVTNVHVMVKTKQQFYTMFKHHLYTEQSTFIGKCWFAIGPCPCYGKNITAVLLHWALVIDGKPKYTSEDMLIKELGMFSQLCHV